MEKVLWGKPVAKNLLDDIAKTLQNIQDNPRLLIIKFGQDPAAEYYFRNIVKTAERLSISSQIVELSTDISNYDLSRTIHKWSDDPSIDGILIQKPFPAQINDSEISSILNPDKDIDGINPLNLGKLFFNQDSFVPCTAQAVIELIKYYQIPVKGKHVVILGRSTVVAKPLTALLLRKDDSGNATVTVSHSFSNDLASITQKADILVAAIGQPEYIHRDMINPGAILIDVGINRIVDKDSIEKYVGDIDYLSCFDIVEAITPVPGGIGTITTAVLLKQLVKASKINNAKKNH